ncbi:hypothetical protein D932_01555 [Enterococcus casseliflavus 14-MB-W-14]|nr:hypothetical protein D932_01555 [Enterococcus casseliflavus 14-MB-W-14]
MQLQGLIVIIRRSRKRRIVLSADRDSLYLKGRESAGIFFLGEGGDR